MTAMGMTQAVRIKAARVLGLKDRRRLELGESPMDYPDGGPRKGNIIMCGNYHHLSLS